MALSDVSPVHPLGAQAKSIIEAWDGNAFADAVTSTSLHSGEVIFSTWLTLMLTNTFGDELGARVGEASSNMLIHALDFALTGDSGVPPSRDYFNGINPKVVISAAFDQTLAVPGLDYILASAPRCRSERPKLKSRHLWTDHRARPPRDNWGKYFYFGPKRVLAVGLTVELRVRSTFHGPARGSLGASSTNR